MVLCSSILQSMKTFRSKFSLPDKSKLNWFPGHMNRGIKVMQQKLKSVDCVIEVHDSRIPLSGRNPNFKDTVSGLRPHILVLNKVDLTDELLLDKTVEMLQNESKYEVIFTNCKDPKCTGISKLLRTIKDISSSNRYNRNEQQDLCAMIIGVPNVGKSSLINALRVRYLKKSKAAFTGAIAGVTRAVGTKIKVCETPLIYIYDTPGVLTPSVPNIEIGMKLALCSTFKDSEVGVINIADYALYWLNKHNNFTYLNFIDLKEPTDDIIELLAVSAANLNFMSKLREFNSPGGYVIKPNLELAACNFINAFRKGTLGKFNLDCDDLTQIS